MHVLSAEVPHTAGAPLTRKHTASPVLFSIAGDVLLLSEYVGHEQTCLYSVTCLGGSRYRSSCFLHSIANGNRERLIAARCVFALASNQSIREFRRRHLTTSTVFTKLPNAKRAEGIVLTVRYPRYPWDTVTLLRYAKALYYILEIIKIFYKNCKDVGMA